jgi:hypothetical protein
VNEMQLDCLTGADVVCVTVLSLRSRGSTEGRTGSWCCFRNSVQKEKAG